VDALEIETRDGLRRIPLDKPRLTIGRLPGNDIVLPYAAISRHHAEVRQRGKDWWIADLGSTNGLHVGGRQVKEFLLRHGDKVLLAPAVVLHFLSERGKADVTVEGTVQLPTMSRPPTPPPMPPVPEPLPNAAEIAAAASMPLPRRHLGLTAPPASDGPATPDWIEDDDEGNAWLDDEAPKKPARRPSPLVSPFALMRRKQPTAPASKKPLLYLCPMCGERTAPDSPYCWNCRQLIAQPCRVCQLYLLPIQATCPRCNTPNVHAVRR
jgi:predicted component of type VI protein secretion system